MDTWKYRVNNKMRGAFGETDFGKKTITVNKVKHKNADRYNIPKKDSSLLNTLVHEMMHKDHPKMTEKVVRKKARSKVAKMTPKAKQKIYKLFQK